MFILICTNTKIWIFLNDCFGICLIAYPFLYVLNSALILLVLPIILGYVEKAYAFLLYFTKLIINLSLFHGSTKISQYILYTSYIIFCFMEVDIVNFFFMKDVDCYVESVFRYI